MNIQDIKTGDDFLTTTYNGFISKAIRTVMKKWAKKKCITIPKTKDGKEIIMSHAGTFVWVGEELYLYGSIDSGYKPIVFKDHYSLTSKDHAAIVMRRIIPLNNKEMNKVIKFCQHLVTVNLLYQYWNFIQWCLLVYLNINLFNKDRDAFTYCFESTMKKRQDLDPMNYLDTEQTDVFQLLNDTTYTIIYTNVK